MSKWHDLRKDPADLPNDERYVWTNQGPGHCDADGIWWGDFGRLHNVFAWCEPNFETDGDELKRFLALWEQAVCEIRGEIKAQETPALMYAKDLCDRLEQSMVAYSHGNVEYAHFVI